MNYFFPKRTKGLASTREEREQLLRTVAATEYTISGTRISEFSSSEFSSSEEQRGPGAQDWTFLDLFS